MSKRFVPERPEPQDIKIEDFTVVTFKGRKTLAKIVTVNKTLNRSERRSKKHWSAEKRLEYAGIPEGGKYSEETV